jgi:integrase
VIRSYENSLDLHILPIIGALPMSEVTRKVLQAVVDDMQRGGLSASTIRNAINPLRVVFRRAVRDGDVKINPTIDLDLPVVTGKRRKVAPPDQALKLIDSLPRLADQVLWAIALLAGLRRGELRALPWANIDLARNLIHVESGWDRGEGRIDPKSAAGIRDVPIIPDLRERLVEWKLACPWSNGLVLGRTATAPFDPSTIHDRARRAWSTAKLASITLHEARHSYASMLIAAGAEPRTVMELMGHSSITVTYDLYGHLFPGTHERTGEQLQTYLDSQRAPSPDLAVVGCCGAAVMSA